MAFLMQADPEIRLTATELANPSVDIVPRRMLWSLVNDTSDAVRFASFVKLMQTGNPKWTSEALKAIRDDSFWVRRQMVQYLQEHPSEEARGAIRQAVTDQDPGVRAGALRAFGALEKPVTIEEVSNVLEDKFPEVQMALIDLALKKGITLPKATVDMLKASPDPAVVEKARSLPG
jgi:HEAT repeat protein